MSLDRDLHHRIQRVTISRVGQHNFRLRDLFAVRDDHYSQVRPGAEWQFATWSIT
jgi:hypothetical protein